MSQGPPQRRQSALINTHIHVGGRQLTRDFKPFLRVSHWRSHLDSSAQFQIFNFQFSIFNFFGNAVLGYWLLAVGYFLSATLVPASPSSALREYNSGHYDQSLKEYERLLEKKSDDPRLHYNAGAAAYRNQKFDEAARQFSESLTAPDLNLQQQAYYNLGNSLFHLGERNPDPSKRTETWEQSLKGYENTLKLNPADADAKFNYQYVKKKLEELKQQQQNQNNKDKNDQQKDQKDQQNNENKKDDQKKDQQQNQQDQNKQDQNQKQKQDSSQKDQQSQQPKPDEKEKEKQQQQASDQSKEQKEKEQQQQSGKPQDKSDDKNQPQNAQTYAAAQMTPDQAKQLLDAQKGEEAVLPIKPTEKPRQANRSLKDW